VKDVGPYRGSVCNGNKLAASHNGARGRAREEGSRRGSGPLMAPTSPSLIDISAIKCLDYRSAHKGAGDVYKSCERARLLLTPPATGSCRSVSRNIEFHADASVRVYVGRGPPRGCRFCKDAHYAFSRAFPFRRARIASLCIMMAMRFAMLLALNVPFSATCVYMCVYFKALH